jgi:thymidylate synthase ThyX
MIRLRADVHSQREIQDYANAMYLLVEPHFPICCEAFEDYALNARTFSSKELEILKENMNSNLSIEKYGLSKREEEEFLEKLK